MWRATFQDVFNDEGVKIALPRYIEILKGKKLPKYIIDRQYPALYTKEMPLTELWKIHQKMLKNYPEFEAKTIDKKSALDSSFLSLKSDIAERIISSCTFCERRCKKNRLLGEKGYCGCGKNFSFSSAFPHFGEEPELVPSGTVFTCGCTIKCIHCQNYEISQWYDKGLEINPKQMATTVDNLKNSGCRNLNMVGGEPTPNTYLWIKTMNEVTVSIPTIWNSNSYYSLETANLLAGFIDVYLLDFKYGNNTCAQEISDAPNYFEACTRNHLMAKEHGELIIRVLVLPGHNNCCTRPILEWIAKNLGEWTRVNLLFQYRPEWQASKRKELTRKLSRDEINEALKIAKEVGLKNIV
ncbi:radical SAM protein [Candidatus Bathyarchaeota archaeon]|nr:radical SAM protein [Candidatus Bathyarchaeota archaeon]